jgi:branched-chain amino acid transport system substrate-binding protein
MDHSCDCGAVFQGKFDVIYLSRMALKSLLLALCAPLAALAQPAQPPVKIAMVEGLSGAFANTGEAVFRNLVWAVERVNQRGGVKLPGKALAAALERYDSKGQSEEALSTLRAVPSTTARSIVVQGNSSANAAALIDAINKHNERDPARRVVFLNYSAVEPADQRKMQLLALPF